jgi:hypothetical protein
VERLEDRQMLSATMLGGSGQSQSQSQSQGQSQFQSQSQSQSVSVSQSQSQSQGQSQSQSIQVSNSQSSGPQTFQGSLVFTSLKVSTSGAVATVDATWGSNPNLGTALSAQFKIDWGDGTTTTGPVLLGDGTFTVHATHAYTPGTFTLTATLMVQVLENGSVSQASSTAQATVTVPLPTSAQLGAVASALTHSFEGNSDFARKSYQHFLGRTPSAGEVNGWAMQMQGGLSDENVEADFLASAEYLASHGGAGAAWIRGLYQDLLGRLPSQAEVDGWVGNLNQGMSALAAAQGFAFSGEHEGQCVATDYQLALHRTADPTTEIGGWLGLLAAGASREDVLAAILASAECFQTNGGTAASWLNGAYEACFNRPADAMADASWLPAL